MAPAKDQPLAFMPSPNDSLYSGISGPNFASASYTSRHSESIDPHDTAALSPLSEQQNSDMVSMSTLRKASGELPLRESVPSASAIPNTNDTSHLMADQTYWYDVYQQARTNWNQTEQAYIQHVKSLQAQLVNTRTDSAFGFPSKENDKVYNDPETVRHAQDKLRSLSSFSSASTAISPLTEQTSAGGFPITRTMEEVPVSGGFQQRHSSSTSRPPPLARIPEDPPLSHTYDVTTPGGSNGRDQIRNQDDPLSPPTSAKLATPPNASLHAGHTPRNVDAPRNPDFLGNNDDCYHARLDGLDEDRPLTGPLSLPSTSRAGEPILAAFDQALQRAASSEALSTPAVLQNAGLAEQIANSPHDETPGIESSEEAEEIPLKMKRSTNFGLAFGKTT